MLKLKGCPRCKGDVRVDWDRYGWFEECMQCGYMRDLKSLVELELEKKLSGLQKRDKDSGASGRG